MDPAGKVVWGIFLAYRRPTYQEVGFNNFHLLPFFIIILLLQSILLLHYMLNPIIAIASGSTDHNAVEIDIFCLSKFSTIPNQPSFFSAQKW
jgi:hypothetical protein